MRQESKLSRTRMTGFTLVELVVVIVVIAILGGMSVTFIKNSVLAYVNSEAYYQLSDRADVALRRMSRDVRNALPNSVWVSSAGDYIEFVPIKSGGRYSQDSVTSTGFSVLAGSASADSGDQLVVYNMGIDGADIYKGETNRTITSAIGSAFIFSGGAFPLLSPASRYYTVNGAVIYACDLSRNRLLMYTNVSLPSTVLSAPQHPTSFSGFTQSIVAEDVTGCSFTYTTGVMQHSGVVTAQLTLSKRGGVVSLVNLINVVNSP